MTKTGLAVVAVMASGLLVGCATGPAGSNRMLGTVNYPLAFTNARDVLSQYGFTADSADSDAGVIKTRPKMLGADGVFSKPKTRETATVRLLRQDSAVVAYCYIIREKQVAAAMRFTQGAGMGNYSGVPDQTPADGSGATTPQQNEAWEKDVRDRVMEDKILSDLYDLMHPKTAATSPATQPAGE